MIFSLSYEDGELISMPESGKEYRNTKTRDETSFVVVNHFKLCDLIEEIFNGLKDLFMKGQLKFKVLNNKKGKAKSLDINNILSRFTVASK